MIKLKDIGKNRLATMGIAAILVMIVHLWGATEWPMWLQHIQQFGQNGVDIFLFLSGLGCFYSISSRSTGEFYQRRFLRIIPSHLIVLIAYGLIKVLSWKYSVWDYYYENSLLAFITHGYTLGWFVSAILILYAITPLLYKLYTKRNVWYWILFAVILLIDSQMCFMNLGDMVYNIRELFFNRIPVYMLGFAVGDYIKKNPEHEVQLVSFKWIASTVALLALFFINSWFAPQSIVMDLCHYIAILLAPVCVLWLTYLFNHIPHQFITDIGNMSLETYLINEKLAILLWVYLPRSDNYIINLFAFVLTLIGADLIRRASNGITRKVQNL